MPISNDLVKPFKALSVCFIMVLGVGTGFLLLGVGMGL